jgi:hypothetical protein
MPNNPKWRTIAKHSGASVSEVIAVAIYMLTDASANAAERGRTQPNKDEHIATALGIDDGLVVSIKEAMQGRFLDGDIIIGWNKRQPKREDGSAERAKKWREEQKAERNRTQPNATERPDTDSDTDTETEELRTPVLKKKDYLNSQGVKGGFDKSQGSLREFDVWPLLTQEARIEAMEHAKRAGLDVQVMREKYNENIRGGREKPKDASKAFPVWCSNYAHGVWKRKNK